MMFQKERLKQSDAHSLQKSIVLPKRFGNFMQNLKTLWLLKNGKRKVLPYEKTTLWDQVLYMGDVVVLVD